MARKNHVNAEVTEDEKEEGGSTFLETFFDTLNNAERKPFRPYQPHYGASDTTGDEDEN